MGVIFYITFYATHDLLLRGLQALVNETTQDILFKKDFIYLFLEREGREQREGEKHRSAAYWESNRQPFHLRDNTQPIELHQSGPEYTLCVWFIFLAGCFGNLFTLWHVLIICFFIFLSRFLLYKYTIICICTSEL